MFTTIDTHVAGEAFRIVIQSSIHLKEDDFKANHNLLQESFQDEKELLLNEPRGYRGINGCIVVPSKLADFGLLFFNHDKDVVFKYGGLVASVTALLETGNLNAKENANYKIETIHGIHEVRAIFENQEVMKVYLESNDCKVIENREEYRLVEVDESRNYLIFPLPNSIAGIDLEHLSSINKWGKGASRRFSNEKAVFDGIIITEIMDSTTNEVRTVTFEKDGSIARSPGFDSTFAILTALRLTANEHTSLVNQSIFDSSITARHLPGSYNRFSVEIEGFTIGLHQFIYDQTDPLKTGFLLK